MNASPRFTFKGNVESRFEPPAPVLGKCDHGMKLMLQSAEAVAG